MAKNNKKNDKKNNDRKKLLKALRKVGPNLGQREFNRLSNRFDGGIRAAARDLGLNIRLNSPSLPDFSFFGEEGFTPAEFDYQSAANLVNLQGNIDTRIAELNTETAETVAEIGFRGSRYTETGDKEFAGQKYMADRDKEARLGVENIRAKGAIDLQAIVNAGNREVENIRGEYGLKGKKIDRSTAVLGGLVNAFNFS